jgi:hypothetical protein
MTEAAASTAADVGAAVSKFPSTATPVDPVLKPAACAPTTTRLIPLAPPSRTRPKRSTAKL